MSAVATGTAQRRSLSPMMRPLSTSWISDSERIAHIAVRKLQLRVRNAGEAKFVEKRKDSTKLKQCLICPVPSCIVVPSLLPVNKIDERMYLKYFPNL